MWFVGDNFLSSTFRACFRLNPYPFYLKNEFKVTTYCSNRFNDKNQNMLSRVQISVTEAIRKSVLLPQFVIIVMKADLLEYLDYHKSRATTLLGPWIEWLVKEVDTLISEYKKKLIPKAKDQDEPFIYWIQAVRHKNFDYVVNDTRNKFNLCLESVVRDYNTMRVVKIKEIWNMEDSALVTNNRITVEGTLKLWESIDAVVKFNIRKRKEFLAKKFLDKVGVAHSHTLGQNPGDMKNFFKKRRLDGCANYEEDHSHGENAHGWNRRFNDQHRKGDAKKRFLLPRIDRRR